MRKVTAYKTQDGTLFIDKDDASKYESDNQKKFSRSKTFDENKDFIIDYIYKNYGDELRENHNRERPVTSYYEGYGWDCENKTDNPIDKCIYSYALSMGDDCCVFCGQPAERK